MATVYDIITDRIVAQLEKGVVPWRQPWSGTNKPTNLVSKKPYSGINVFLLGSCGFASPYWVTFNQCKELGGSVKKGEKSCPVVFWKRSEYKAKDENGEETEEIKQGLLLRYYNVFNVLQCEGIDEKKIPALSLRGFDPIVEAERIVQHMPKRPEIEHKQQRACYRPDPDTVNMPTPESFASSEEYYSTLFHELTHSTGHESRLHRKGVNGSSGEWTAFGTTPYAQEELVAEMGAAFLCGHCGIENVTIDNSASYIEGWLRKFKSDKKVLVFAAAQAQKASDFILGN